MTLLELFDEDEIAFILEALEHRRRYYANRIPQAETNAACGGIRPALTLESYREIVRWIEIIISKWVENTL